jgi:hypothetical protein
MELGTSPTDEERARLGSEEPIPVRRGRPDAAVSGPERIGTPF